MSQQTFLSYDDLRRNGVLSTNGTALQYCLDVGILRPHHFCTQCQSYMHLKVCPTSMFSDDYCWTCPGAPHHLSIREESILHKRKISLCNFLHLLWMFCNSISYILEPARLLSMNTKTVRPLFNALRQCMAKDLLEDGAHRKLVDPAILSRSMNRNLERGNTTEEGELLVNRYLGDFIGL